MTSSQEIISGFEEYKKLSEFIDKNSMLPNN
jgi:hypothetical protein